MTSDEFDEPILQFRGLVNGSRFSDAELRYYWTAALFGVENEIGTRDMTVRSHVGFGSFNVRPNNPTVANALMALFGAPESKVVVNVPLLTFLPRQKESDAVVYAQARIATRHALADYNTRGFRSFVLQTMVLMGVQYNVMLYVPRARIGVFLGTIAIGIPISTIICEYYGQYCIGRRVATTFTCTSDYTHAQTYATACEIAAKQLLSETPWYNVWRLLLKRIQLSSARGALSGYKTAFCESKFNV